MDEPRPLIASGSAADVFDLGDGTVLRRYREVRPGIDIEAALMRHLTETGFPVPTVHRVDGCDLVMDRIDGPTMMEALESAPSTIVWRARQLARLQRRLARHRAPDWLLADTADAAKAHSVLHLDLHPANVILSPTGPVVIGWGNAAGGPAGFDAAVTYVEAVSFAVTSTRERVAQRVFSAAFRFFRGRRLMAPYLGAACDHRLADSALPPDERTAVAELRRRLAKRRR
ncbi:MAG: phosphotransferase [Ilumatobacter sp.]